MKEYSHLKQVFISFFAAFAFFAHPAFAVPENDYANQMQQLVWPFYQTGEDGSFAGVGGKTIRYKKWENPAEVGAIVIFTGRTDPFMSYAETIYDFAQKGYSVYAFDHRGQGSSDRLLPNPQLGYVYHFSDYVTDAKIFYEQVVMATPHSKVFLVSHSMGGAIAALYLKRFPEDFTAAALVAPMLSINTGKYTHWEARLLAWFNVLRGQGAEYAPGQTDFDASYPFKGNDLTSSEVRFENRQHVLIDHPQLLLGGATNRWIKESMKADAYIHHHVSDIETPILMLTAGSDTIVNSSEELYFCAHVKSCVQVPPYVGSQHEILAERDPIRNDALAQIFEFFSEH